MSEPSESATLPPDGEEPQAEIAVQTTKTSKRTKLRLVAVVVLALSLALVAKLTGLDDYLDANKVRDLTEHAGAWGFVLFIVLFSLGEMIHIPGFVFVGAATVAYPPLTAALLAYVGSLTSVSVSFILVRAVGGHALAEIERPLIKKILGRLDRSPILTVALVRLVFWMTPAVNYAFAMTRLRFRDHFVGSAIGLVGPIFALSYGFSFFVWN